MVKNVTITHRVALRQFTPALCIALPACSYSIQLFADDLNYTYLFKSQDTQVVIS